MYFIAAAEHLDVQLKSQTNFPQYLDIIATSLGREVPYRKKLTEINRVRVASKHDGILPDKKELGSNLETARQFFEEATNIIFAVEFWSISLIDLLDDREETRLLREAEQQFKDGDFLACLISCRKAVFVVFEESYNIKKFEKEDPSDYFRRVGVDAPYYAQSADYIQKHVSNPFEYIVRDHNKMDAELTKEGTDHTTFWNIWRLTPEVYRYTKETAWMTKFEPENYAEKDLKDTAAYVLDSAISMMLQLTLNRREWRTLGSSSSTVRLRSGVIRVFAKADTSSQVANELEIEEGTIVIGNFQTPGLNSDGMYWNIIAFNKDTKVFAYGYVPAGDVILE
jgi:hypothetical protein